MPYADREKRLEYSRSYWRSEEGREKREASKRSWRERNREKMRAHSAVARALRKGTLVRPLDCEGCGGNYTGKLEAHHDDYSKPLDVKWLCDECHKKRHIELRMEARPYQDRRWDINTKLGFNDEPEPEAPPEPQLPDPEVPF